MIYDNLLKKIKNVLLIKINYQSCFSGYYRVVVSSKE
jgi:hypothetical protein